MSRRAAQTELEFGSDSFLDIIANIVGVLIILIVVAGMRVSNAPVPLTTIASADELDRAVPEAALLPQVAAMTRPKEPSLELVRVAREVQADVDLIESETTTHLRESQRLAVKEEDLRRQLESISLALANQTDALETDARRIALARAAIHRSNATLAQLQTELEEAKSQKSPVEQIKHWLTPLSRTVHGKELHFRLAENRVARVPLEELIDRLRAQVDRQKHWLAKFPRHQGTVGPVGGFTMEYVVERQQLSGVGQLRYGRGAMQIGVSQWQLKVEPDLQGESGDVALNPGSAFHLALKTAEPGTTLTFWVYPDSFSLFRRLQKFAHREGLTVAARPLPHGVPIAGSPHGTKSAGQ